MVGLKYRSRSTGNPSVPHPSELGTAHAEIVEAEGDLRILGVELGEQPSGVRIETVREVVDLRERTASLDREAGMALTGFLNEAFAANGLDSNSSDELS